MSQVLVTREALLQMKNAMNCFQTDVQSATTHIKQDAAGCTDNIHRSILQQKNRAEQWKRKVGALGVKIEQCEAAISANKREQQSIQKKIGSLNAEANALHQELQNLMRQRQYLARTEKNGNLNRIEADISSVQNQISNIQATISQHRTQLNSLAMTAQELNIQQKGLKDEYDSATLSLRRAEDKLSNMESVGNHAIHCMETLLSNVENFQRCAIDRNNANLSGIGQCLSAIDEYISVSL